MWRHGEKDRRIGVVADGLLASIDEAGGPDQLIVPRGYNDLARVLLDPGLSLNVRDKHVENVLVKQGGCELGSEAGPPRATTQNNFACPPNWQPNQIGNRTGEAPYAAIVVDSSDGGHDGVHDRNQ